MNSSDVNSVFGLVTKLCEKFADSPRIPHSKRKHYVKKFRSTAFRNLLTEKYRNDDRCQLVDSPDPICHVLSLCYVWSTDTRTALRAEHLKKCLGKLNAFGLTQEVSNALSLLVHLRSLAPASGMKYLSGLNVSESRLVTCRLPYQQFSSEDFTLTEEEMGLYVAPTIQQLPDISPTATTGSLCAVGISKPHVFDLPRELTWELTFCNRPEKSDVGAARLAEAWNDRVDDESSDVWADVLKTRLSNLRTWESFALLNPEKYRPFITEAGPKPVLLVRKIAILRSELSKEAMSASIRLNVIPLKELIVHIKYLLAGVESETFPVNSDGLFALRPNVAVEGLTPETIAKCSQDLILCGTTYRALNAFTMDKQLGCGYIFNVFGKSVRRYLVFYRAAVAAIAEDSGLIGIMQKVEVLKAQLMALVKVYQSRSRPDSVTSNASGSVYDNAGYPFGIHLIAHIYRELLEETNRNVYMVLFSAFYPCCQVYFGRFLRQWLFEGVVDDPYGEFFIRNNMQYISKCSRSFWTKGHQLNEAAVPDFLKRFKMRIFQCGKTVSLLRRCNPNSPLLGKNDLPLRCCITADQLDKSRKEFESFYAELAEVCGPPVSIAEFLQHRRKCDDSTVRLIALKQATVMKRKELERAKRLSEKAEAKKKLMEDLLEQIRLAVEQKELRKKEEKLQDILIEKENERLNKLQEKIFHEEAEKLVTFYEELYKVSEKKRAFFEEVKNAEEKQLELLLGGKDEVETTRSQEAAVATAAEESQTASDLLRQYKENLTAARQIKAKVLALELGVEFREPPESCSDEPNANFLDADEEREASEVAVMNAAHQRNRLNLALTTSSRLEARRNRQKVMEPQFDIITGEFYSLTLKGNKNYGKGKPASTVTASASEESTPSSAVVDLLARLPGSSGSSWGYCEEAWSAPPLRLPRSLEAEQLQRSDLQHLVRSDLNAFLQQSVEMALGEQSHLASGELLKHFVQRLDLLAHLASLKNYFFLLDGEFAHGVVTGLQERLHQAAAPADLLDIRTLRLIMDRAVRMTSADQPNAERLSFVLNIPTDSLASDSLAVLSCLSLSYRVEWPLTMILSRDVLQRYNDVFKYLLKLYHSSWTLHRVFQKLKEFGKKDGVDETVLLKSPQYRKLQLFRHVMLHFVQTLLNYTVSEVLNTCWLEMKANLANITTLDELHQVHASYLKTVIFRCLLNTNCEAVMTAINQIFVVISKFYKYLEGRTWCMKKNGTCYRHPNFKKLQEKFHNFREFAKFVFRHENKMARVGYQPHLVQMLDVLDINDYYTQLQNS